MPRKIDPDNLSEDDKKWLASWNRPIPEKTVNDQGEEVVDPYQKSEGIPKSEQISHPEVIREGEEFQQGEANSQSNESSDSGGDSDQGAGDDLPPYEEMTVEDLQKELDSRGLPKSGNKQALIDRLEADDESDQS